MKDTFQKTEELPHFTDKVLIFHRGVGVTKLEGYLVDRKIDLLTSQWFNLLMKMIPVNMIQSLVAKTTTGDKVTAKTLKVAQPKKQVVEEESSSSEAKQEDEINVKYVERITLKAR